MRAGLVGRPRAKSDSDTGRPKGRLVLHAPTRNAVDQCYIWAIDNGGMDKGAPALRTQYHPDYYGAYFRDLDGNKIWVCCHNPVAEGAS